MQTAKLGVLLIAALALLVQTSSSAIAGNTDPFTFTWQGSPAAPQPWNPQDWDVIVHSRDTQTWDKLEPMQAQHGPDCSPPPATHLVTTYEDAVFICRNHMMTAINGGGYGVIYFAPNEMVDFSTGIASIQYRVSTARSSGRDWHDIWVTPFEDNLVLPLYRFPDLQGPPRNAVHVQLTGDNTFIGNIFHDFVNTDLPRQRADPYDRFLDPSATTRAMFELDISRTHIRFGMPGYAAWWIDTDVPDLGFTQGVVQLGHHSYNPTKAENGLPGTWHWSDFSISSAVRFTMLRGTLQAVNADTPGVVCFPGPAPASSWLRFAGVGRIEVSFDRGRTFAAAIPAGQVGPHNEGGPVEGLFASYWMPIPTGASAVVFRGRDWWGGPWWIRDPAVWSRSTDLPTAAAVCPRYVNPDHQPSRLAATGHSQNDVPWLASVWERLHMLDHNLGSRNVELLLLTFGLMAMTLSAGLGFAAGRHRRRRPPRTGPFL